MSLPSTQKDQTKSASSPKTTAPASFTALSRDISPSTSHPHTSSAPAPLNLLDVSLRLHDVKQGERQPALHQPQAQHPPFQPHANQLHPQPHLNQPQPQPHPIRPPPQPQGIQPLPQPHENQNQPPLQLRPTGPLSSGPSSDHMTRGQSVSFCESEPVERSRRFTISAQPSAVNLAPQSRQGLTVQLPLSSRKNSVQGDLSATASRNNSALGFSALHLGAINGFQATTSHSGFRVDSPSSVDTGANLTALFDKRATPSPPPVLKHAYWGRATSPLASPQVSDAAVEADASPARKFSYSSPVPTRQGSLLRCNSTRKSNKTVVEYPVGPPVPFQQYLTKEDDKKCHILLGCTGSVATIKVPLIIDKLFQTFGANKISVQLVVTQAGCHFLKGLKIHKDVKIWRDEDLWSSFTEWNAKATTTTTPSTCDPQLAVKKHKSILDKMVLHNELRKWADIMLIAPLSANTLAKLANGIADNLLTSIVRGWGPVSISAGPNGQLAQKKPILVAPAMNTFMYTHPMTAKQLKILADPEEGFGFDILKPVEKVLICGDIGMGGMREWLDIVETLRRKIKLLWAEKANELDVSLEEENEEDEEKENDDDDDEDDDDDDDDDDDEDDDDDDDDEDEESRLEDTDGSGVPKANSNDEANGKAVPEKETTIKLPENIPHELANQIQRTISPVSNEARSII